MTVTKEQIDEYAEFMDEPLVLFDGLEGAIVGIGKTHTQPSRVIYSVSKVIEILMEDGIDHDEAWEHFGFNIECLWAGPHTPILLYDSIDW